MLDRDTRIRKDAKTHSGFGPCVMTGRPYERVRVGDGSIEDRIERSDRATCGKGCDLEALMAERRCSITCITAFGLRTLSLDPREVLWRVSAKNVFVRCRNNINAHEVLREAGCFDQRMKALLGFR
jgi:hypothetical protein